MPVALLARSRPTAGHRGGWSDERAFSLIETLLVCALISTLSALSVGVYVNALEKARVTRAIGDLRTLEVDIQEYHIRLQQYPPTLAAVRQPVPVDPWGRPYVYTDLSQKGSKGRARKDGRLNPINADFDLYSVGRDGRTATPLTAPMSKDDVIRAREGAFRGLASEF